MSRSDNQRVLVQPYQFVFSQMPSKINLEIEICVQEIYQGTPLGTVLMQGEGNRIGHREELQYSCTRALANSVELWSCDGPSELDHLEARVLDLYTPTVTSH